MPRIALIGPESVGKSTLSLQLSKIYGMPVVEEYARTYVERLNRSYEYDDVETIARKQVQEYEQNSNAFFDTEMIITKVWFDVVYSKRPAWLDEWMMANRMDYYILLKPDIEWQPDPTRENKNRRQWLYDIYLSEIKQLKVPYSEIGGQGDNRLNNCKLVIDRLLEH